MVYTKYVCPTLLSLIFKFFLKSINIQDLATSLNNHSRKTTTMPIKPMNKVKVTENKSKTTIDIALTKKPKPDRVKNRRTTLGAMYTQFIYLQFPTNQSEASLSKS